MNTGYVNYHFFSSLLCIRRIITEPGAETCTSSATVVICLNLWRMRDIASKLRGFVVYFCIHRVWQEHHTVVVGWLSRMHSLHPDKTGGWFYKYSYSGTNCNYSMVLTGGAFFHKVNSN